MSYQSDFVQRVYETALGMGMSDPVARLAAAQSAVETQYGTSLVGNNYFGIKAGSSWTGPTVSAGTKEESGGRLTSTTAKFRAYDGFQQSLADWYRTLERRWPEALTAPTVEAAAAALKPGQAGGYATDSQYASKLVAVNNRYVSAPTTVAQTPNAALDAIKAATAMDPASVLSSYTAQPKASAAPAQVASVPSYVTTPPAIPAASVASPFKVQYPSSVSLNVPVPQLLADVRAAEPGLVGAATFLAKDKDAALTNLITSKLPSYMQFDPASSAITVNNLNNPDVQKALSGGVNSGFPKIDAVFTPYLQAAQKGMTTPLPLPREARPVAAPAPQPTYQPNMLGRAPSANFGTSYDPAKTLATIQNGNTAILPPSTPWATPLSSAARSFMTGPAPNPLSVMMGTSLGASPAPAAPAPSQKAETPPPVAAQPVAPPPVYTWTTSSWLPSAPPTPATRPGVTTKPEAKTGLFGNPLGMLSGFLSTAMKPTVAPRGQFGQPLAVGGTYRNGAVWAADGSGYGGSPGQSTWGLKPGDRVYDTNTGEWGLKVGQPVTWTGGTSGNTSTATGTFQGTSTGRTYNVGQQYTAGGYVYTAMPDGTFKKV